MRLGRSGRGLVVIVALPAAARQAEPGTTLWPVREVGQQVRDRLADDPVHRANLRLNTAGDYLAAGAGAGEERREDMADAAEEKIKDALEAVKDLSGRRSRLSGTRAIQLEPGSRRWSARRTRTNRPGRVAGPSRATTTPALVAATTVGRRRRAGGRAGRRQLRPGGGGDDGGSGKGSSGSGSGSGSGRSGSGSRESRSGDD